jgi:hypothetical protein
MLTLQGILSKVSQVPGEDFSESSAPVVDDISMTLMFVLKKAYTWLSATMMSKQHFYMEI